MAKHPKSSKTPKACGRRRRSVAFSDDGERLVGQPAKRQAVTNPERHLLRGQAPDRPPLRRPDGREGQEARPLQDRPKPPTATPGRSRWEELFALAGLRLHPAEDERDRGSPSRPEGRPGRHHRSAYFNDAQRQATKDAGKIAGLEVLRIINEPTAAALAYGLDKTKTGTIAVYDLGGGTFDVSILEIGDGVFEVKSTNGDTFLGGEDFDMRLVNYLADEFQKEQASTCATTSLPCSASRRPLKRQDRIVVHDADRDQSAVHHGRPVRAEASDDEADARQVRGAGSGPRREDHRAVPQALKDAGLTAGEIGEVVLVGGMTRMPKIQEMVSRFFGKEPHKGVNPDEVVAIRCCDPGRRAAGRRQGRAAARRDAAVARHRDAGRRVHPHHRPQHHDPDKKSQVFSTARITRTR